MIKAFNLSKEEHVSVRQLAWSYLTTYIARTDKRVMRTEMFLKTMKMILKTAKPLLTTKKCKKIPEGVESSLRNPSFQHSFY
jgi:hypothetical protein